MKCVRGHYVKYSDREKTDLDNGEWVTYKIDSIFNAASFIHTKKTHMYIPFDWKKNGFKHKIELIKITGTIFPYMYQCSSYIMINGKQPMVPVLNNRIALLLQDIYWI